MVFTIIFFVIISIIFAIIIGIMKSAENRKNNDAADTLVHEREESKRLEADAKKQREANEKNKKNTVTQNTGSNTIHNIVCPFCYEEFKPRDVRFRFDFNGVPVYLSANPNSEETKKFCRENGNLFAYITERNGLPVKCVLCRQDNTVLSESPLRVCRNDKCNQPLSVNAGTYSADNGLFVIGLKSSGKTVYITTAINRLKEIIPKYFGCNFRDYNQNVTSEYYDKYYNVMYNNKTLPDATVARSQLTCEVVNNNLMRTVGITFSDIAGEISDNANEIFQGDTQKIMSHSNYFLMTIDLKEINRDTMSSAQTVNIINNVLSLATIDEDKKRNKYLAVVITKSDELVNFDQGKKGAEAFRRDMSYASPIFREVKYDMASFNSERAEINRLIKQYMWENHPGIVQAAETAFYSENINYFAVSALGQAPVEGKLVSNIVPVRVEEPVLWLLGRSGVLQGE